jgi:putative hydrolase of the HAD superfamily
MSRIKNLIFDLGGVLLNINYAKTTEAFKKLGVNNFDAVYSQAKQTSLFDDFETGKISPEKFVVQVKNLLDVKCTDDEIITSWNAMLLDFPKERLDLLQQLKNKYTIVLLSNTNEIHKKAFLKILQDQHQLNSLAVIFQKVFYSHEINLRKPNLACFEFVLSNCNFNKNETVFFDDSEQHIVGAQQAGIKAYFVNGNKTILDYFDNEFQLKEYLK